MTFLKSIALAGGFAVIASTAGAAVFDVFEAGTTTLLGSFEAPATGGAVTSGSFSVDGGMFDVLGIGPLEPLYNATDNWITGTPGGFGAFFNSVAYNTTDISSNPITCGVGECVLSFTSSGDPGVSPAEWYLNYLPDGGAAIDFGYYEIKPGIIPLPAGAILLLSALGFGGLILRRRG